MNIDYRKNIDIEYNLLNLPCTINENGMFKASYKYIADGKKASTVDENGMGFDYLGSLVYNNDNDVRTLESTTFGGGRINATNNGYDINYFITDHLGSTRVIVDDSGNITEQNDYYPFGKRHENASLMNSVSRWKFSGKEVQTVDNMGWLDFHARMFLTEEVPFFLTPDPLMEKYYSISQYNYCLNSPTNCIDPDGRKIVVAGKNIIAVYQDLALIYGTHLGREIIDELHKSNETYTINADANKPEDSGYAYGFWQTLFSGKTVSYYHGNIIKEGISFFSHEILGHELFHAFQDETGQITTRGSAEKGAVMFENYLRKVYGKVFQRLTYSGNRLFGLDEPKSFATNGERRNINSVRFYAEEIGGSSNNSGDEINRQDNTRVNMQRFVIRVFEYMNENGLEAVTITF